jgi:hypothetical protein
MAHFSPELWTPPIWYGSRNSNVSRRLCILIKWGSVAPLEQARASDFEIAISRFESCHPIHNEDWGDPRDYNIITRKGEKLDTEYTVMASPKTPVVPVVN